MSTLESSVTLEDVFSVVEGRRVPLAPELAGYLTLEVADGSQAAGGEVDPRTVYISEEGTVALVRPKKDAPVGDAETSVRAILAKLLEASGSATPALSASAKRKAGAGLPALVSELEAALIPVNRAAGRRALARLAREVKRVMLGVGRNASVPAPAGRSVPPRDGVAAASPAARPAVRESAPEDVMSSPDAPPGPRGSMASFGDEALTAKRPNQVVDLATLLEAPDIAGAPGARDEPKPVSPAMGLTPPPHPGMPLAASPAAPPGASPAPPLASPAPPLASPAPPPAVAPVAPLAAPPPAAPARAGGLPPAPGRPGGGLPPPPNRGAPPVVGPPPRGKSAPVPGGPVAAADARAEIDKLFGGDEVDSLLSTFEVSNVGEKQMRTDLKAIAGLDPTPGPPDATTLAELTKDVGKGLPKSERPDADGVEALLALSEPSGPLAPPLPPPGFGARGDDARLAPPGPLVPPAAVSAPREYGREPGAPTPPLAPPSPLVPISPEQAGAGPLPMPTAGMAAPAAAPPPAAAATAGRRAKLGDQPPPAAATAAPAVPPAPATTVRRPKGDGAPKTTGGNFQRPRAPRTGLAMLILTLFVLVAGGIAVWMFKPAFFTGKKRRAPTASVSAAPVVPAPPRCKVALVVSDVPPNAEILLRMGQAPLDVERMPVGTRLEFVATAEGYSPRRAVIKGDAPWEKAPDGKPRVDVPIQLDPTKAKAGTVDPWPPAEPGSQVGGSGSPGTVHVVSNVRGAEVWLLAGLGPEARIEQLRCDAAIDVLLAGPPNLRKRLHVADTEIQAAPPDPQGNRVVSISAK